MSYAQHGRTEHAHLRTGPGLLSQGSGGPLMPGYGIVETHCKARRARFFPAAAWLRATGPRSQRPPAAGRAILIRGLGWRGALGLGPRRQHGHPVGRPRGGSLRRRVDARRFASLLLCASHRSLRRYSSLPHSTVLSTNSKSLSLSAKRKMPAVVLVAEDVPMFHLVMAEPMFVHLGVSVSLSKWSSPSAVEHQAQGWDTCRKGWDSGQGAISLAHTQSLGCAKALIAKAAPAAKAAVSKSLRIMSPSSVAGGCGLGNHERIGAPVRQRRPPRPHCAQG